MLPTVKVNYDKCNTVLSSPMYREGLLPFLTLLSIKTKMVLQVFFL